MSFGEIQWLTLNIGFSFYSIIKYYDENNKKEDKKSHSFKH